MSFTWQTTMSIWLLTFAMFALSGSGAIAGRDVLWLALAVLVGPFVVTAAAAKWKRATVSPPTSTRRNPR